MEAFDVVWFFPVVGLIDGFFLRLITRTTFLYLCGFPVTVVLDTFWLVVVTCLDLVVVVFEVGRFFTVLCFCNTLVRDGDLLVEWELVVLSG